MKKVCILLYQNMRFAPFVKIYERVLSNCSNVEWDIIYLNRDKSLNEADDIHHIPIRWKKIGINGQNIFSKMWNAISYSAEIKKIVSPQRYDFCIVLTTMPAVLLSRYLTRNYKNRYIIDIRDYTKEHNCIYFLKEKNVIENSNISIISSPAFRDFLPNHKYYVCHNINITEEIEKYHLIKGLEKKYIRISYIGSIQYAKQCKMLVDLVDKDSRFEFLLYGNEPKNNEVSSYVKEKNNKRIRIMGSFTPEEKENIYLNSDVIFNYYGNDTLLVQKAISNKYYDGAFFKKPLIVSPNTEMARLLGVNAFICDLEDELYLTKLLNWYKNLDVKKYDADMNNLLTEAVRETKETEEAVRRELGFNR